MINCAHYFKGTASFATVTCCHTENFKPQTSEFRMTLGPNQKNTNKGVRVYGGKMYCHFASFITETFCFR